MNSYALIDRLNGLVDLDLIALTDLSQSLTYRQLLTQVDEVARWLSDNHVGVLALHADNSIDWVLLDLACQQANVVFIPLPDFFSRAQLNSSLAGSRVDLVFTASTPWVTHLLTDPTSHEIVSALPVSLRAIRLTAEGSSSLDIAAHQIYPRGTQKITFTSGSTGSPKGVCLSAGHQWQTAHALASEIDIDTPTHLCLLPLATLLENVAGLYAPLLRGGTIVVPRGIDRGLTGSSGVDVNTLLNCLTRVSPDTVILLPQLLTVLIAACDQGWNPPRSLQFIAVGGAKVAPELLQRASQHGLPVYEGYGLSECGSVVALNTPQRRVLGTVGKRLPHCEIRIQDGQIVVTNPVFLGYQGDVSSWYPKAVLTGDMGRLDGDYLSVNGRKKNMLISSFGRNIHPEWVESELLAKPLLTQCVVLGENRPHLVAILSAPESVSDTQISDWLASVNQRLPDYAQIQRWQRLAADAWKPLLTANGRPQRQSIDTLLAAEINALYRCLDQSDRVNKHTIVEF